MAAATQRELTVPQMIEVKQQLDQVSSTPNTPQIVAKSSFFLLRKSICLLSQFSR